VEIQTAADLLQTGVVAKKARGFVPLFNFTL
jgi:hypothetical protein